MELDILRIVTITCTQVVYICSNHMDVAWVYSRNQMSSASLRYNKPLPLIHNFQVISQKSQSPKIFTAITQNLTDCVTTLRMDNFRWNMSSHGQPPGPCARHRMSDFMQVIGADHSVSALTQNYLRVPRRCEEWRMASWDGGMEGWRKAQKSAINTYIYI